jgi:putative transposase
MSLLNVTCIGIVISVCRQTNEMGHTCSRYRVARLMRQHGIVSKHKKKFRVTTNSTHSFPVAENILQRRFNVSKPSRCWVSDITYVPTLEGWLYMAIKNGCVESGLIHHSDRGVQ